VETTQALLKVARNPPHLAAIRRLRCLSCGRTPCGEAAHLRMSAPGKPNPGIGRKPEDRWALPLCHWCHMTQHSMGERAYWDQLGIDPIAVAQALFAVSPDIEAMLNVIRQLE
jgi:hypothetical protein